MEKIVERNLLYDFYGDLLTDYQKKIYEDSAYADLSLSEIADTYEISRQSVHDLLKRCDKQLLSYEEKLHLISRHRLIKQLTLKIRDLVEDKADSETILSLTDEIMRLL